MSSKGREKKLFDLLRDMEVAYHLRESYERDVNAKEYQACRRRLHAALQELINDANRLDWLEKRGHAEFRFNAGAYSTNFTAGDNPGPIIRGAPLVWLVNVGCSEDEASTGADPDEYFEAPSLRAAIDRAKRDWR